VYAEDKSFVKSLALLPESAEFNGFSSGKIYINIEMCGITAASIVEVLEISGDSFYKDMEDFIVPKFALMGQYEGVYGIGDKVSILPGIVCDVLDPGIVESLTVLKPDGSVLSDIHGVKLEGVPFDSYEVVLENYGYYRLRYSFSDINGNMETYLASFQVVNYIAPVITVSGAIPETLTLGSKLTLPEAYAVDDIDGQRQVACAVTSPDGMIWIIQDNREIECNQKGTYRIRYFAIDVVGNLSEVVYTVNVN